MSKPLAELLRRYAETVDPSDDADGTDEMARRLRKLDEAVAAWQVSHRHIADGLRRILDGEE